jgi:hypothetical protein
VLVQKATRGETHEVNRMATKLTRPILFYFFSVPPSPAGGGREGVGYERQPIGFPVQFALAADVGIPGG